MEVDAILPKMMTKITASILKTRADLLIFFLRRTIISGTTMLEITNNIFKNSTPFFLFELCPLFLGIKRVG